MELSYDLDYVFSSCEYYLHFVEIFAFCGNIHVPWILSAFRGYIHISWKCPHFVDILRILWMYPRSVDISAFRGYYPNFVDIIRIGHITNCLDRNVRHGIHSHLWSWVLCILVTL